MCRLILGLAGPGHGIRFGLDVCTSKARTGHTWRAESLRRWMIDLLMRSFEFADDRDDSPTVGASCQCLNLLTSIGGTRSKVEGGDCHDLEPEGMREDTRHKIYTGLGSQSSVPYILFGVVLRPAPRCCSPEGLSMFG
jgi:hypothetical protein